MQSRDEMHRTPNAQATQTDIPATDTARMFARGLAGGKPAPGALANRPEWFYKGDGGILRAHRQALEIPSFALDGGEEPEIVGCYVIDPDGRPRRLGFALANEWSDHATEQISYLHLAPSKFALVPLARRSTRPRIFRTSRCAVRFAAAAARSTTAAN